MKKFKYKLQTLLSVTESLEKESKNTLAVINRELNELYEKRNKILEDIEKSRALFKNSVTASEFVNINNYITYLKKLHVEVNLDISIKEYEKLEVQAEVTEHMRKRKIYEKLKEKKLSEYKKEIALENIKIIDDFISGNGGE